MLRREFAALRPAARARTRRRTPRWSRRPAAQPTEPAAARPAPMTRPRRRSLVVVAPGLGQPSSTRLLADRLAAATVDGPARRGRRRRRSRSSSCASTPTTWPTTCSPASRAPTLRAALDAVAGADGADRRHADLQRVLQRPVQDVLRRARAGRAGRQAGAARARPAGTARHSLALEHALRPLFAYLRRGRRADRRVRGGRGLGAGDATTATWSAHRARRGASSPTSSRTRAGGRAGRPVRRPDAVRGAAPRRLTRR